jgi:UTP---glucose-1-phosphate uridylyltransferase
MSVGEMQDELQYLQTLSDQLKNCADAHCRLEILNGDRRVSAFFADPSWLRTALSGLSLECEIVIKSLIAIGQHALFHLDDDAVHFSERMRHLLDVLIPVEEFYREMGGIVGYHYTMRSLMRFEAHCEQKDYAYDRPPGCDISVDTQAVREYILEGIRSLPCIAELYPVGGAADRLHLLDPDTHMALPAAKLRFCGKTLLEGLISDVQAREYLYYKLWGACITIPIAMMTSQEKDNHRQILAICQQNQWFGRPRSAFHFFCQPAVPLIDKAGRWCTSSDGKLLMKPGGHGVIWKMARDSGVFDAWKKKGIRKILIRQINNPIAGCDGGLLAFSGIGFLDNKAFGFASCPRQIEAAEGINVLLKRKMGTQYEYCLTNVEYCDFKKWGIEDKPVEEGSCYSFFPSNTNILFADIAAVEEAIVHCPIPGLIVNLKKMHLLYPSPMKNREGELIHSKTDSSQDSKGEEREAARLESTMQNIADCLIDRYAEEKIPACADLHQSLQTFLTYNLRRKTISTTKKSFVQGQSLLETPEGCFYDMLQNAYELLKHYCSFDLPELDSCEDTILKGPAFIFLFHPALGPLYPIIGQKLRKGRLSQYSELQLDIAEIDCIGLHVDGSLKITAQDIMGNRTEEGLIQYNAQGGKCVLRRVQVINRGIDRQATSCYWKNEIARHELCEILIHGNGEFIAEDIILQGNWTIEVEKGFRVRAVNENGTVRFMKEKIDAPSWEWNYSISDGRIVLNK